MKKNKICVNKVTISLNRPNSYSLQIVWSHRYLSGFLRDYFGDINYKKRIPEFIFHLPENKKKAL